MIIHAAQPALIIYIEMHLCSFFSLRTHVKGPLKSFAYSYERSSGSSSSGKELYAFSMVSRLAPGLFPKYVNIFRSSEVESSSSCSCL